MDKMFSRRTVEILGVAINIDTYSGSYADNVEIGVNDNTKGWYLRFPDEAPATVIKEAIKALVSHITGYDMDNIVVDGYKTRILLVCAEAAEELYETLHMQ